MLHTLAITITFLVTKSNSDLCCIVFGTEKEFSNAARIAVRRYFIWEMIL